MKKFLKFMIAAVVIIIGLLAASRALNEKTWKLGTPLSKERVKVGVIYSMGVEKETSGYDYVHNLGILEMQRALGLDDGQIIRKTDVPDSDFDATEHALRECVMEGANIIFATAERHARICQKLAEEYPNVIFAQMYVDVQNDSNLTSYYGRAAQARYLSGVVAGLRTGTGKIGYVAAMGKDNSQVTSGLNAFALGVESVNPQARVYVRVTHRWYDPEGEALATRQLIESGCDVIAQHCDTPSPQIEAQKAGVWGIGYNSDMKADAPRAVLASVVWNWGVYYTRLAESVIDGSFTTKPYLGGLEDDMVTLTTPDEAILPAGAAEAVAAAKEKLLKGEIDIFEGAAETNDGRIISPEERHSSVMDWYYRNVVEAR
jgi:basic membrane protein A